MTQLPIHMARTRSVHLTYYCLGTFHVWLMCWVKLAHHWRVSWMGQSPFLVLCSVWSAAGKTSMESARFTLFRSSKIMALPPTYQHLMQHLVRVHLQVMLWKVADHPRPLDECSNITNFGWKIVDGIPVPVTGAGDPAPPQLIDVIRCQCKAQGKK